VVGLDNGGTSNNATVLDADGRFLVDRLVESPSHVREGPAVALDALVRAFDGVLELPGVPRERVRAVGLDTPGPASADGVISARAARPTSATRIGAISTSAAPSRSGWGCGSATRTTATRRRSTPSTWGSAAPRGSGPRGGRAPAPAPAARETPDMRHGG